jgi:hypothetical protein
MIPLGSVAWKARWPQGSSRSGMVMATPSAFRRASSASRLSTLKAFEGLGLDDIEMDAALTFLLGFVHAAAGAAHGAAYSPDHAYQFGLQRVLDGLGALIDTRGS